MTPPSAAPPAIFDRAVLGGGRLLAWLFFVAFAITVYEVLMRYLLRSPTSWVHETTTTLCAIGFAFGGAYAQLRGEHMRVTSLIDRLPAGGRTLAEWLSIACGFVYLAGLSWGTVQQAIESIWRFEGLTGSDWAPEPMPGPPGWPLPAIVKTAVAGGALLFLLVLLLQTLRRLRGRIAR